MGKNRIAERTLTNEEANKIIAENAQKRQKEERDKAFKRSRAYSLQHAKVVAEKAVREALQDLQWHTTDALWRRAFPASRGILANDVEQKAVKLVLRMLHAEGFLRSVGKSPDKRSIHDLRPSEIVWSHALGADELLVHLHIARDAITEKDKLLKEGGAHIVKLQASIKQTRADVAQGRVERDLALGAHERLHTFYREEALRAGCDLAKLEMQNEVQAKDTEEQGLFQKQLFQKQLFQKHPWTLAALAGGAALYGMMPSIMEAAKRTRHFPHVPKR